MVDFERPQHDDPHLSASFSIPIAFYPHRPLTASLVPQKFIKTYGKLGIVVYIVVSISTIIFLYLALDWGVDLSQVTEYYEISSEVADTIRKYEGGSKFVLAYAVSKVLLPVRLTMSIMILFVLKNVFKVRF